MPEPNRFLRYRLSAATWNFTSGKSDVYVMAAAARRGFKLVLRPTVAARRGFNMVLFTEPSKHFCTLLVVAVILLTGTHANNISPDYIISSNFVGARNHRIRCFIRKTCCDVRTRNRMETTSLFRELLRGCFPLLVCHLCLHR